MEIPYKQSQQCVADIHKDTNQRIYSRNIPSQMLQPYLDVRPAMSKYSYFPIVEPRAKINVPLQQIPTYNVHNVFNPGNTQSPWSGFSTNINIESELRNQIYAIQKCSQATYVPKSNSDLYTYNFKTPSQPNPHQLLFQENSFEQFNPNPDPNLCGLALFMNSTRCQIKDMTNHKC
jgi:hypothetical protein